MERRPTESIQRLVRHSRLRVVIPIQLVLLLGACALVWKMLGATQTTLAAVIIGILIVAEVVLLVLFLREPPESDEAMVRPIVDNVKQTVIEDPAGGTIVVDKVAGEIRAHHGDVRVSLREARAVHLDLGVNSKLFLSTRRDLVVISEIRDSIAKERSKLVAVGRLLARAAAVPFEGEG